MSPGPVVVAVDPWDEQADLLAEALRLARLSRAKLVLLHALPLPAGWRFEADGYGEPAHSPALDAVLRDGEAAVLPRLRALAAALPPDADVELRVAHGAVAASIVEVARQLGASLLVVGTHGRSGLVRAVLGSVAEAVLRTASVPVVVVRRGPAAAPALVVHRAHARG